MTIAPVNAGLFLLAATLLLGSPGPGIAALIAVGRSGGFTRGLRFYGGLQLGLALAAGISAAGLFSVIQTIPFATAAMTFAAAAYLVYLAWGIATAPVGVTPGGTGVASTALGGFLLGITNPKSYIAFISLMASYAVVEANASTDAAVKWLICVAVMVVVDLVWLWLGVVIRKAELKPGAERALNIVMGATILATAVLSLV